MLALKSIFDGDGQTDLALVESSLSDEDAAADERADHASEAKVVALNG